MQRMIGRAGCAALGALVAGCYTYQPVAGVVPEVGMQVAFDVNDAGRVALGGQMGPEIAQVEGQLVQKDGGSYLLAISTVRLLRGGEQVWTGEQVRLKSEYLGSAYQRRFSMGRSVALGAAALGGFGAFLVSRSILGSGSKDLPGQPGDTVNTRLAPP